LARARKYLVAVLAKKAKLEACVGTTMDGKKP